MKKMFIAALLGFFTFSGYAQKKNVSLGIVGGFGHSWIKGGAGDNQYNPSGSFGGKIMYSAQEHIGISADILYSIEGGTKALEGLDSKTRLNYLRIPVTGSYFFGEFGDRLRPKVSLGPSVGFLMGGQQEINGIFDEEIKDQFKKIDFGLHANAGLHYRVVSNTWLVGDIQYYHGLTDISEVSTNNKNRNIGLNVGVMFGIGTYKENQR